MGLMKGIQYICIPFYINNCNCYLVNRGNFVYCILPNNLNPTHAQSSLPTSRGRYSYRPTHAVTKGNRHSQGEDYQGITVSNLQG